MPAIPVSTGLQADPNSWIDGPVQIVLSTDGSGGGGAERPAIAPWPCEWESCTGAHCTVYYRECRDPLSLCLRDPQRDDDIPDPPLGWRGRMVLIGLLGISAAVAISGAWLLLDWFQHIAGG